MDAATIDEALHREADNLLHAQGFLPLLQRFGTPHVHGSYALQLMTWRDLDVYLVADEIRVDTFFALGSAIATTLKSVRMQFRNERLAHTPGLPAGLYWGIYLAGGTNEGWKIDLWAVTSVQHDILMAHHTTLVHRLTPASRRIILELKTHYWRDPRYRRSFTSQDLYEAVLEHGVSDVAGVEEYLLHQDNN